MRPPAPPLPPEPTFPPVPAVEEPPLPMVPPVAPPGELSLLLQDVATANADANVAIAKKDGLVIFSTNNVLPGRHADSVDYPNSDVRHLLTIGDLGRSGHCGSRASLAHMILLPWLGELD